MEREDKIVKKKSVLFFALILILLILFPATASAAELSIDVKDNYSTGEPVLFMINTDYAVDPNNISVVIEKPNGTTATTTPRQQSWNTETECFETYSIDLSGTFTVTAEDKSTGALGTATFDAGVFSMQSTIFMGAAGAVFVIGLIVLLVSKKKNSKV